MAFDLEKALGKVLDDYENEVFDDMQEAIKATTKVGVRAIKADSPKKSGKYASGWTSKMETGRLSAQGTIYNAKTPGLPHLLEHGHVIRNGTGRTFGNVKAYPHIAAVEQRVIEFYQQNIKERLSQ